MQRREKQFNTTKSTYITYLQQSQYCYQSNRKEIIWSHLTFKFISCCKHDQYTFYLYVYVMNAFLAHSACMTTWMIMHILQPSFWLRDMLQKLALPVSSSKSLKHILLGPLDEAHLYSCSRDFHILSIIWQLWYAIKLVNPYRISLTI
jgi:hypothetical protein